MKDITYDKDILKIIKDLTNSLTKEIIIRKIDDKICIRKNEKTLGIFVDFSSPVSNFDFEGEMLAFAEDVYSEFYKFYSLFESPSLKQDSNKLILKEKNQTIKFNPSNPDIIKNELKGSKPLPNPVATFNISKDQFAYIAKMIRMVDSKEVQFVATGKTLELIISNKVDDNESNITFELEKEVNEKVDLFLNTTIFESAPDLDYTVNIISDARMFQFISVNEKFTLNLYTGLRIGT